MYICIYTHINIYIYIYTDWYIYIYPWQVRAVPAIALLLPGAQGMDAQQGPTPRFLKRNTGPLFERNTTKSRNTDHARAPRGCQKSISPQGSGLQKWIPCPDTLFLDLDPLLYSGVGLGEEAGCQSSCAGPASNEVGTHKAVTARFWPWLPEEELDICWEVRLHWGLKHLGDRVSQLRAAAYIYIYMYIYIYIYIYVCIYVYI